MTASNVDAALLRIHTSEFGVNREEPANVGGISVNGITLVAYNEYRAFKKLPIVAANDLEVIIAPQLSVSIVSDEERAFYLWKVFDPLRFNDLPLGLDYAVADAGVNEGDGAIASDLRRLFRTKAPANWWDIDDTLLSAINAAYQRSPLFAITAICDQRWSIMMADPDFIKPSHTDPTKIIGDGRVKRMNVCYGGALQFAGIPLPKQPRYFVPSNESIIGA